MTDTAGSAHSFLNGKSLLITGGTGSFGRAFVQTVLEQAPDIRRLVVLSRDELKQMPSRRRRYATGGDLLLRRSLLLQPVSQDIHGFKFSAIDHVIEVRLCQRRTAQMVGIGRELGCVSPRGDEFGAPFGIAGNPQPAKAGCCRKEQPAQA
jgi:hypothetical protein